MPWDEVTKLKLAAFLPRPMLAEEVTDAMWADYGRRVAERIHSDEMIPVLTVGGLKAKDTRHYANIIRTYLLTGAKP